MSLPFFIMNPHLPLAGVSLCRIASNRIMIQGETMSHCFISNLIDNSVHRVTIQVRH